MNIITLKSSNICLSQKALCLYLSETHTFMRKQNTYSRECAYLKLQQVGVF